MQRAVVLALLVVAGFMACIPDPPADLNHSDADASFEGGAQFPSSDGAPAGASALPAYLDFGGGNCGGVAPPSQRVTLKNDGKDSVEYAASLVGKAFSVSGLGRGVVAPGAEVPFDVTPDPVPQSAHAGDLLQAVLKIETNDVNVGAIAVPLKIQATGAQLEITPSPVDFGSYPQNGTMSLDVSFKNKGNAPVDIVPGASPNGFGIDATKFTVAANSMIAKRVEFTPDAEMDFTQPLALTVQGVVCGQAPASITLKGTGVAAGDPYVTPGGLDFGITSCGDAAPPAQTVMLENPTGAAMTIVPTIDASHAAYYDVAGPATVAAGGSGIYTVTPKKLSLPISLVASAYDATLTLSGSGTPPLTLTQAVQGAVLVLDATNVDFGQVTLGDVKDLPFVVRNEGNMAATVTLTVKDSSAFYVPLPSASVAPPSFPFTISYRGIPAESSETMTMTATGAFCTSPPPGLVTLRGQGVVTLGDASTATDFDAALPPQ